MNDAKYTKFIQTLQSEHFTIKWDIEVVNCSIKSKANWYSHLKQKYTYPLNEGVSIINDNTMKRIEVVNGIRELNEGFFKYQNSYDNVEFFDRLLFISAYHRGNEKVVLAERKFKDLKDHKVSITKQNMLRDEIMQISMQITPDVQKILTTPRK